MSDERTYNVTLWTGTREQAYRVTRRTYETASGPRYSWSIVGSGVNPISPSGRIGKRIIALCEAYDAVA